MSNIFISHSSKDNAVALEVKDWLVEQGHRSVFLDFDPADGIPSGRNWERELYTKLRECRAIIVLCSRHSMASSWCFAEIAHGKSLGKHIFPLKIAPCTIAGLLEDVQIIDMTLVGEEEAYQRLWRGLKAAGLDPKALFNWDNSRPPYPGLLAFEEEDAAIFFGRDCDIREGLGSLNRIRTFGGSRLAVVLGASGSGKSSLVRAGLVPRLKQDERSWLVVNPFRPLTDPFAELGKVLSGTFARYGVTRSGTELGDVLKEAAVVETPDVGIFIDLAEELRQAAKQSTATVLLVIDQMEELLSYSQAELNSRFLLLMKTALEVNNSPFMAIGTLRSDFLGAFQEHPALEGNAFETLTVGRMGPQEIAQIIEGPAKVAGIELEQGLVQVMGDDTKTDDALPLLAFTLRELWEGYGEDRCLEIAGYHKLGRLEGSIARAAEAVLDAYVSPKAPNRGEVEQALHRALLKMVRIDEEGNYARRIARWNDLPAEVHDLLEQLVKARLLVSSGSEQERFLEVGHEALFRSWKRLASWLKADFEFLLWRKRLNEARLAWEQSNRDDGALLRGALLVEAESWYQKYSKELSAEEGGFIQSSQIRQEQEQTEKERREREKLEAQVALETAEKENTILTQANQKAKRRIYIGSAILGISLIGAIVVWLMTNQALNKQKQMTNQALASQQHAEASALHAQARQKEAEAGTRLERAGSIAWQQFESGKETEALLMAMQSGQELKQWVGDDRPLQDYPAISPLFALQAILHNIRERNRFNFPSEKWESVKKVSFSLNGRYLAVLEGYGNIQTWKVSGEPLHSFFVYKAEDFHLSSDGQHIATVAGTTSQFWKITGEEERSSGPQGPLAGWRFSPDRKRIALYGGAGQVRLWDFFSGELLRLETFHDRIKHVDFSIDGRHLATVGDDNIVRLWDLSHQQMLMAELNQQQIQADRVRLGIEGRFIVTLENKYGGRYTARLWKLSEGQFEKVGDIGEVRDVKFSPDNKHVATMSIAGTIELWDLSGRLAASLKGHKVNSWGSENVWGFRADGEYIAAAGADSIVRLWNMAGELLEEFKGHHPGVLGINFSSNGQHLITVSKDGTVRVWSFLSKTLFSKHHVLKGNAASLSPDGKHLATIDEDTLQFWDLSNVQQGPLLEMTEHGAYLENVTFSPDGQHIATSGYDGTVQMWDLSGQQLAPPLKAHLSEVWCLNFSLDGTRIVTAGSDSGTSRILDPRQNTGAVRIWNLSGQKIHEFAVQGMVKDVSLSPDGQSVATLTTDGIARLWDLSGQQSVGFPGHRGGVRSIAFSPDSRQIASAGADGMVRLWDLSGRQLDDFTAHQGIIRNIAFGPDSERVATLGDDNMLRLWDLSGRQLAEFRPPGRIGTFRFTLDGTQIITESFEQIITGSLDGTVGVLPVEGLHELLDRGCDWLKDYLASHPNVSEVCPDQ